MISRFDLSTLRARTRHISLLKLSLLSFATLMALSLILWPHVKTWLRPSHIFEKEIVRPVNTATKPAINGVDSHNQPYRLVADFGQQVSADEMEFDNPVLTLSLKSGAKVTLSATKGNFFNTERKIKLMGTVTLQHSDGYKLKTTLVWVDCAEGTAMGDEPVGGDGPAGAITSRGFRITERGDKVVFLGQPELLLSTKKQSEQGK